MRQAIVKGFHSVLAARSGFAATIQTFIVKVLILAINLGTGVITARLLGAEGRGELAAMLLWPQFLAYTLTLGLPKSILYNLKKFPEQKSKLFAAGILMSIGLGLIATLIGIVFLPIWLSQYSDLAVRQAQWLMLTSPIAMLGIFFLAVFDSEENFTSANQLRYWLPFSSLMMIGLLVLTQLATPFSVALAYVLPNVPLTLWMLARLWRRYRPAWTSLGKSVRQLFDYGIQCYGIDLIMTLSTQIAQAFVVSLLAPAAMGLYVVALSMARMLTVFEDSIVSVLLPKATARSQTEVIALTGRSARITGLLTAIAASCALGVGPLALKILYGAEFLAAVPLFQVLLLDVVVYCITSVLLQSFMALGKPGIVTVLQGIGLGCTVPLMLTLVPKYQILGAGLALLISTFIRLILTLMSFPWFLKVKPPRLILSRADLSVVRQALKF